MAYLGKATRIFGHAGPQPSFSRAALGVIISESVTDDCRCWCSPEGCTPLTKLLEGLRLGYRGRFSLSEGKLENHERTLLKALQVLTTLEDGKSLGNPWVFRAILRYYTFAALDLRHTCCRMVSRAADPLPDEEIQEIAEEDSERLKLLEDLAEEFERDYEGKIPIHHFIRGPWAERMRWVDRQLASEVLTKEQHRDISAIVNNWRVFGPKLPSRHEAVEKEVAKNKGHPSELEYWLKRLDQIAIDPDRPFIE